MREVEQVGGRFEGDGRLVELQASFKTHRPFVKAVMPKDTLAAHNPTSEVPHHRRC
jgi:hypothetical protein